MHRSLSLGSAALAGVAVAALIVCAPGAAAAKPGRSEQSISCTAKARAQHRAGGERERFYAACMKGALAPPPAGRVRPRSEAAAAVTAPSGSTQASRSDQCNAEGGRRGLRDSDFQAFRKGCLASAAPVRAIETARRATTPTAAKPKLESYTNRPPR